jgi:hypothetical protein
MQRAYMDGLEADGTISSGKEEEAEAGQALPAAGDGGPSRRQGQAGTDVIDLAAMRADLERKRGGE